jgi:hypothetical protein
MDLKSKDGEKRNKKKDMKHFKNEYENEPARSVKEREQWHEKDDLAEKYMMIHCKQTKQTMAEVGTIYTYVPTKEDRYSRVNTDLKVCVNAVDPDPVDP